MSSFFSSRLWHTPPHFTRAFMRTFLLIGILFNLTACGLFHHAPRHMTTPAQWEKYGYHTHLQNSSDDD
ncbi:MAG: hypothetical protein J6V89_04375 [Acetobacter sp.]|nr:hypothetical protein [Acetobacter sp.]MBO7350151.1 hypothetical protein [Acetobacter sp.]MBQ5469648.1 hypothetical protein [Acetobacter sp.]MBQ5478804.1 hypothetical protein [Acetobacter sp.]MBQ5497812.1 hypothetical protein [Acetobacter sp.]